MYQIICGAEASAEQKLVAWAPGQAREEVPDAGSGICLGGRITRLAGGLDGEEERASRMPPGLDLSS